jgi:hypothetical protein
MHLDITKIFHSPTDALLLILENTKVYIKTLKLLLHVSVYDSTESHSAQHTAHSTHTPYLSLCTAHSTHTIPLTLHSTLHTHHTRT